MNWELHRPFLQKADVLADLLEMADQPSPKLYYKSKVTETLDEHVERSNIYSNDYVKVRDDHETHILLLTSYAD